MNCVSSRCLVLVFLIFVNPLVGFTQKQAYDFNLVVSDSLRPLVSANNSSFHFTSEQHFTPKLTIDMGAINAYETRIFDFYIVNNAETALSVGHAYWAEPQFEPRYDQRNSSCQQHDTLKFSWICHAIDRYSNRSAYRIARIQLNAVLIELKFNYYYLPCWLRMPETTAYKSGILKKPLESTFTLYRNGKFAHYLPENSPERLTIDSVVCSEFVQVNYQADSLGTLTFHLVYTPQVPGTSIAYVWIYTGGDKLQYRLVANIRKKRK